MASARPITAKTIFTEATVAEDGLLHLENPMPTLRPGEKVTLIISSISEASVENSSPLRGTVTRYDDPFGLRCFC